MKKLLTVVLLSFLAGCVSTPAPVVVVQPAPPQDSGSQRVNEAGQSFTVPIDEHTVWRVNIRRVETGLDNPDKAVVEIKNELDRSIMVDFSSTRSHYTPSIGDFSSVRIEVDPGSYELRPSAPSLGSVPDQITYSFTGGTHYKMTWTRSHEAVDPRGAE